MKSPLISVCAFGLLTVLSCCGLQAQQVWKLPPQNQDFGNPGNWTGTGPGPTSTLGSLIIRRTLNLSWHPVLRFPRHVRNLHLQDYGALVNGDSNVLGSATHDLTVGQMLAIEKRSSFLFYSSDCNPAKLRCEQLFIDESFFALEGSEVYVTQAYARKSNIRGTGRYVIGAGGILELENSCLIAAEDWLNPCCKSLTIDFEDEHAVFDWDGQTITSRGSIKIDHGSLIIQRDMSHDPFNGVIEFSGPGSLHVDGKFSLAPGLENEINVCTYGPGPGPEPSLHGPKVEITGEFSLNGGSLNLCGPTSMEDIQARQGLVRCISAELSFDRMETAFPDIHSGGAVDFELRDEPGLRVRDNLTIGSHGRVVDFDGDTDDLTLVLEPWSTFALFAKGFAGNLFSGDLRVYARSISEFVVDDPWQFSGTMFVGNELDGAANRDRLAHWGSKGHVTVTGAIVFEESAELKFHSPLDFESGSRIDVSGSRDSVLPFSQLLFGGPTRINPGASLFVDKDQQLHCLDEMTIEPRVLIQGGGDLIVEKTGRLEFGPASAPLKLFNEGVLDLGHRSQPVELVCFEQSATGETKISADFQTGQLALPGSYLPVMEEAVLDGTLEIGIAGPMPVAGDSVVLLAAKRIRGQFQIEIFPSLPSDLEFDLQYNAKSVVLHVRKSGN